MIVRMWEARARPELFAALLAWVYTVAVPELEQAAGHAGSEVFQADGRRVVVLSRWHDAPVAVPEPPGRLLARDPHSWDFTPVER